MARTEPSETHAERVTVEHALARGYLQPEQLQAAQRQRDEALARGQPVQLLAILSNRFLAAPHAQELALVYQRQLAASSQGPVEEALSASGVGRGGPGGTVQLPPRRPSERLPAAPAHPSRTQVEDEGTPTLARSGERTVQAASRGPLESIGGYQVVKELARGGMGVVYVARKPGLDRKVALKVLINAELASSEDIERFKIEAQATARLKHEGLVTVYDVGEDAGRPFIVMELVEGESLKARLLREGPLQPKEAAELTQKLAKAMFYAHKRLILHRDLKPSNVLLDVDGEPKITDFGLAKDMRKAESGERGLTMTGDVMGTPAYMPPEQATGELDQIDRRADIYSLGATLYEMLTGKPPFEGSSPMRILSAVMVDDPTPPSMLRPGLDADLETICLKCLEKRPADRYHSARALADDLGLYLAKRPIRARPPTLRERVDKWLQRNRGVAVGISAGLVLLGLLTVGGAYWLGQQQQAQRDAEVRAEMQARRAADDAAELAQRAARQRLIDQAQAATAQAQAALDAAADEPLEARLGLALTLLQASSRWDALANDAGAEPVLDAAGARSEAARAAQQLGDLALAAGAWSLAEAAYGQLPAEQCAQAIARVATARRVEDLLQGVETEGYAEDFEQVLDALAEALSTMPTTDAVPLLLRRLDDVTQRLRADRNQRLVLAGERRGVSPEGMRRALAEDLQRPVAERLVAFHPKYRAELIDALAGIMDDPAGGADDPIQAVGRQSFPPLRRAGVACLRVLGELPADGAPDAAARAAVRAGLLEFCEAWWRTTPLEDDLIAALERYDAYAPVEAAITARRDGSYYGGRLAPPRRDAPPRRSAHPAAWYAAEADAAVQRGEANRALDLVEQGLGEHPADVELLLIKIQLLGQARQLDAALATCGEALRAHPDDSRVHKNTGITLAVAGELDDAIRALTRALELEPEDRYPLLVRGQALAQTGELARARADFQAYLDRAAPDDPYRDRAQAELRRLGRGD